MEPHSSPTTSYWWRETRPTYPALDGPFDAEIAIVGGGITGVTLAHTLAQQGAAVAVLETGRIAGAASGRNAGFLLAAPAEPYQENIAMWGRESARANLLIGRRSHQRIRELVESLGIECDYRVNGSLRLARTEEEAEDQRASLPDLHADGFKMLETRVTGLVPAGCEDRFAAAFVTAEDGELDPVRFLHGLAAATVKLGARLHEHTPVSMARWSGGLWTVHTPGGEVHARTVVIATNAYAPRLVPTLTPFIAPRRGQMLSTAPLGREVAPRPTYSHWGYRYWRQLPDTRLLIGGWRDLALDTEVGFDEHTTPPIQQAIETGLEELVPGGAPIEHRWSGIMGFARDGRPLVGWLDPEHHVAICAGYTGHGMGMAAGCTQDLAALLAWKEAPGIATFDPNRFPDLRRSRAPLTALGVATA
ncbi:MAG: NAD(P)/FAD-dependent oxidoreductase [Candidatus Eisenbacteria bacterium]